MSGTLPAACKSGTGLLLDCQRWLHLLLLTGLQGEGCLLGKPCSAVEDGRKEETDAQKRRNLLRKEKFLKKKFEDLQWKNEAEAGGSGRPAHLVESDRGLPSVSAKQLSLLSPVLSLK